MEVDFRLDPESFDMVLSNGGDLQAIAGAENMAQAIIARLKFQKGELINNPEIGVGLVVGTKVRDLNAIRGRYYSLSTARPQNRGYRQLFFN